MILLLPFAVVMIAAQAVAAQPTPSAMSSSEAAEAVSPVTAATLARVVAPAEIMIPLELEQARKAILALPTLDKDAKELEQEYPGLYAAVWTAMEPEMRRWTEADFPSFWAALEQLYASRLTEQEAQALLTFYRSATGQKLLRNLYGNFDAAPLFADMARSDNWTLDAQQAETVTDAAKKKAIKQIGPEDEASLLTLVASIDLQKFRDLGAETQKITLDWVNKEDPEGDEKLTKIVEDAMDKYMSTLPRKQ